MTKTWLADFHEKTDLNRYPSVAYRGGIGYRLPNGETVSSFVGHPVHYFDGVWKPITLQAHSNGDFEGSDFSWRGGQILHKGKRLFEPRAVIFNGVRHDLSLRLDGNVLRATLPFGEYRILFMEKGVREELVIPDPIEGLIEFDVPHAKKPSALHKTERHIVGGAFGESFKLTKDMNYPLVIDPDYAGDTADGRVYGSSATFATARSTSTNYDSGGSLLYMQNNFVSGTYEIYRSALKFLTSGIPDGDAVSDVKLWAKVYNKIISSSEDFDAEVIEADWSASDPISAGNRETIYDLGLSASVAGVWKNTAGVTTGNGYLGGSLTTTWINKTGSTYCMMVNSRERANLAPSSYQYLVVWSANAATSTDRPILTVTHAAAATAAQVIWFS